MPHHLPHARAGQIVGLLGGSFDPPHEGHVHVTREAIKRFGLGQVWWLVSPGNPLKAEGPADLDRRMRACRDLLDDSRVVVTDIERHIGTRYTAQTLEGLQKLYPGVRFVWLMGADNLASFHRWDRWRDIMRMVPIGVIARPGDRMSARFSKAARVFRRDRLKSSHSLELARGPAPRWCFVNIPLRRESSTALRASGAWRKGASAE